MTYHYEIVRRWLIMDNQQILEILLGAITILSLAHNIRVRFSKKSRAVKTDSPIERWFYICFGVFILIIVLIGSMIDPLISMIVSATMVTMILIAEIWKFYHRNQD